MSFGAEHDDTHHAVVKTAATVRKDLVIIFMLLFGIMVKQILAKRITR